MVPSLERGLTARGILLDPGKTVALARKGHVPTPEGVSRLAGVGARIANQERIKVGVSVGTDELPIESVITIMPDRGAKQVARMLPRTPEEQAANLTATGSMEGKGASSWISWRRAWSEEGMRGQ